MPNIEIHGLPRKEAETLASQIFNKLRKKPHIEIEEVVVTIYPTIVINITGNHMPFLRVASTPLLHLEEIVELLKVLNIDIEVQELKAFHQSRH